MKVGELLAEWSVAVEPWKVADFARAVQDDHAAVPAPTFPVVLNAAFIERLVREILPVDRSRTVHGEQDYEYLRPLRVGDRLRCRAEVEGRSIEIYLPYLEGTSDEKMYRVVSDRARWFQVVMGERFEIDESSTERLAQRVPLPPEAAAELTMRLGVEDPARE